MPILSVVAPHVDHRLFDSTPAYQPDYLKRIPIMQKPALVVSDGT